MKQTCYTFTNWTYINVRAILTREITNFFFTLPPYANSQGLKWDLAGGRALIGCSGSAWWNKITVISIVSFSRFSVCSGCVCLTCADAAAPLTFTALCGFTQPNSTGCNPIFHLLSLLISILYMNSMLFILDSIKLAWSLSLNN